MASKTERTVVNAAVLVQGIVLVTFPALSTVFTSKTGYGLSSTQYGDMFLPQVVLAITASLLGAGLARRITTKRVYLLTSVLTRPHAAAGIAVFALAGLGCSALLPLTISFGEQDLTAMAAAAAGGIIAFYQLGYGIAAFGVGPLKGAGISLSAIFGFTAVIAGMMALLSFFVIRRRPAPAEFAAAGPGSSRPADTFRPLPSESP